MEFKLSFKDWNIERMTGYKPMTTCYMDFSIAEANSMIKDSASSERMRSGTEIRLILYSLRSTETMQKEMVLHSLHMIPPEQDAKATEIHSSRQMNR